MPHRAWHAMPLQIRRTWEAEMELRRYFGCVKIGRLAIRSSCAVGCFFFGFLISRFFASLFPMP
jgi:hypothetical protein